MPKNEKRKEKKKEYSAPKRFAEFSDTILLSCKCPRIFLYAPIEDKTSQKKKKKTESNYLYTNFSNIDRQGLSILQ